MMTEKPLITIALAVYEPNLKWLEDLLRSLDGQTYPNLELIVHDDCSSEESYNQTQDCVGRLITRIPYQIGRNKENQGSDRTFEQLTEAANGTYIAYCDQDDIWVPDKLEKLEQILARSSCGIVCSDVQVIDASGRKMANSITQVRRRHIFYTGDDLPEYLLYHNFVMGCTILLRTELARASLPFIHGMVHDHYLTLFCSLHGGIDICPEPLIQYRIHSENQSNVLSGICSPEQYFEKRILPFYMRSQAIYERFGIPASGTAVQWARARILNYQERNMCALWKMRHIDVKTSLFELIMLRMPRPLFRLALRCLQRGIL